MHIFFLISLFASVVGAICGIGGGIIIKPVLDMFQVADITTINFLSGCTVLSMSSYSVVQSMISKEKGVSLRVGTLLAIGAIGGGFLGKHLFLLIKDSFAEYEVLGAIQAGCLTVITIATLVYILLKKKIKTHNTQNTFFCITIGLALGTISSFLGIGGGPIYLVVLYYFFSMDTKTAASNSLYIILFSQLANLLATFFTRTVPDFSWSTLCMMVVGGVAGGVAGRHLNKKMKAKSVDHLFIGLIIVIIGISTYNLLSFLVGGR